MFVSGYNADRPVMVYGERKHRVHHSSPSAVRPTGRYYRRRWQDSDRSLVDDDHTTVIRPSSTSPLGPLISPSLCSQISPLLNSPISPLLWLLIFLFSPESFHISPRLDPLISPLLEPPISPPLDPHICFLPDFRNSLHISYLSNRRPSHISPPLDLPISPLP